MAAFAALANLRGINHIYYYYYYYYYFKVCECTLWLYYALLFRLVD